MKCNSLKQNVKLFELLHLMSHFKLTAHFLTKSVQYFGGFCYLIR